MIIYAPCFITMSLTWTIKFNLKSDKYMKSLSTVHDMIRPGDTPGCSVTKIDVRYNPPWQPPWRRV